MPSGFANVRVIFAVSHLFDLVTVLLCPEYSTMLVRHTFSQGCAKSLRARTSTGHSFHADGILREVGAPYDDLSLSCGSTSMLISEREMTITVLCSGPVSEIVAASFWQVYFFSGCVFSLILSSTHNLASKYRRKCCPFPIILSYCVLVDSHLPFIRWGASSPDEPGRNKVVPVAHLLCAYVHIFAPIWRPHLFFFHPGPNGGRGLYLPKIGGGEVFDV